MAQTQLASTTGTAHTTSQQLNHLLLGGLEWGLLLAALGLWAGSRDYHPAMGLGSVLLVGSWLVRWLRTGRLARPTPLDFVVGAFMLSVLVGLWAAPQVGLALPRLYLFLGALGVFYALANLEGAALRWAALGLVMLAAALGLYFATQHSWASESVKFGATKSLGLALNAMVPDLGQYKPHPNVVASVLGVSAPIALALLLEGARRPRTSHPGATGVVTALAGLALLVILAAVVMTESRAVWIALAAATGLAVWWWLAGRIGRSQHLLIFWLGTGLALVVVLGALIAQPHWLTRALGTLPGPTNSAVGRLELFGQVWRLAQATPLTGGGLGAFPALYSTYSLDIPVLQLTHAHNAYLNVLVEQGWPGLAALALILGLGAWIATRELARTAAGGLASARPLLAAGAAGLVVVGFQGLGDGTLVASRAIPFLFVPAALVMAALPPAAAAAPAPLGRRLLLWAAAAVAVALVLAAGRQPLEAAWLVNRGAVRYARVELALWPTGEWPDGRLAPRLAEASQDFEAALTLDPANVIAHYRLGLQARLARDFEAAADHLRVAAAADPGHRGLTKTLAYTYVWLGNSDTALPLLRQIPEARSEMEVYSWWWGVQGRPDLAQEARRMFGQLAP